MAELAVRERKKPGRQPKLTHARVCVSIHKETRDRVDEIAVREEWDRSYTLDQMVRHFLGLKCDTKFLAAMQDPQK
jgi:hypothetical protein